MTTKTYFVISVDEDRYQNRYQEILSELKAIAEVESVERIKGTCDLIVQAEAPVRAIFVANKILPKEWVKRLLMLKVDPFRIDELEKLSYSELIRLKRVIPVEEVTA